ncbi:hypothetical protein DFH11DRAFT_1883293 [Phellopilus nigrolimitatus]|nr:hypothetical protein DFH11DRAFT_1883293 [Phellopilus nigrolimitatus]
MRAQKPRLSFHPATATGSAGMPSTSATAAGARDSSSWRGGAWTRTGTTASVHSAATASADLKKDGFFKALTGRGKEKEKAIAISSVLNPPLPTSPSSSASPRMTNVFSLVERFTFRPSPTESSLPTPPPFLPPEIQYWAGVIMRNACRKDESRGGIRQCANMLCGKWESFPREFAKCRRCRKAKYCGKECQSCAWSEGHRFWCSAREGDDIAESGSVVGQGQNTEGDGDSAEGAVASVGAGSGSGSGGRTVSTVAHDRVERRLARDREHQRLAFAAAASIAGMQPAAHFSVARNNGTTTASEFARPRGASEHGHARVPGLPSASSNTIAPANPVTSFFGPGNTLGGPPATSMSLPISMRRRAAAAAAGPSSITTTPLPVNHMVPRPTAPAPLAKELMKQ